MKSKVVLLCDYKSIVIPEEQFFIGVSEEEMQKELERISRRHAVLAPCAEVKEGDMVVCALKSGIPKFNRPTIQFAPGKYLFNKTVEDGVIGMKPGEVKTVEVDGTAVEIEVQKALRNAPAPIDDSLIQKEKIEGINTVEAYCARYKERALASRLKWTPGRLAGMLRDEMIEKSQFEIDEEEREMRVKAIVAAMKMSYEHKKPLPEPDSEEGKELLETFELNARKAYINSVIAEKFAIENNAVCSDEEYQRHLEHIAETRNIPLDKVRKGEPFGTYTMRKYDTFMFETLTGYIAERLKTE